MRLFFEIPPVKGAILYAMSMALGLNKGRTHKYIRRVPKPGGGYRYYYRTSGVTRSVKDDLKPGAKFRLEHNGEAGHFEVTGRDGDRVTLRHDESGGTMTVNASELQDLLHREHADVVQAQQARTKRRLEAARKHGTKKQIARLEAEAKRFGVEGEKPKHKPRSKPRPKAATSGALPEALHKHFSGKKQKIEISVKDGKKKIDADVLSGYAVHKVTEEDGSQGRTYNVTHVPTGLAIAGGLTRDKAKFLAEKLHREVGAAPSDGMEAASVLGPVVIDFQNLDNEGEIDHIFRQERERAAVARAAKADAKLRDMTKATPPSAAFSASQAKLSAADAAKRGADVSASDEWHPHLAGTYFADGKAVATDGHRLVVMPASVPDEWEGTIRDKGGKDIGVKGTTFPDYTRVATDPDRKTFAVEDFDAKHARDALRLLAGYAKRNGGRNDGVRFEAKDGQMLLTVNPPEGERMTVPIGATGMDDGVKAEVNAAYLRGALKGDGAFRLSLDKSKPLTPIHVRRENGEHHVIMPMKMA